ncbi:MAG: hypothetical protein ABIO35_05690 [Nitrobacter sp.]
MAASIAPAYPYKVPWGILTGRAAVAVCMPNECAAAVALKPLFSDSLCRWSSLSAFRKLLRALNAVPERCLHFLDLRDFALDLNATGLIPSNES